MLALDRLTDVLEPVQAAIERAPWSPSTSASKVSPKAKHTAEEIVAKEQIDERIRNAARKKGTVHPRPAYSGGFQPAPTELEKHRNYLNLSLILGFRA
jgi:pyridoxine/pyridoxamine 5'-phosphate oxidase